MLERLTLTEMSRRIRERELDARELLAAHLRRIDEVNPQVNAFVRVLKEHDFDSLPQGPLHGVPVTIKDGFDVEGLPTLAGSRFRESHVAACDAPSVARLRQAGAVLLGKTNVPELLSSYETDNFVTGRTNNPANLECTPGGSSGGEAAAIASYCSPGGIGSDGGGSIRVPAHFCGIAGFKPTHRIISGRGQFPGAVPPVGMMASPGPMARNVADVRLLFDVLRGVDAFDSMSTALPETQFPAKVRIGVLRQFYGVPVHPAIAGAVEKAASALSKLGFEVVEFSLQGQERAPNVWAFFFGELAAFNTRGYLAGREADAHWTLTENLREAPAPDAVALLAQFAERERLRSSMLRQMEDVPFLLMPPGSIPAFRHRERRWSIGEKKVSLFPAMALVTMWNLFGFPALAMPASKTAEGLPAGVQIVGRPFSDRHVLEIGERLERAGL
ncbi:MAG: amidase [Candidatus Solibacter usitatus]|nr:amidase [Candidatus Solibacter usitatus]